MDAKYNKYIAGLLGFVAFLFCGGARILDTSNIGFLMAGDPAQHWIGWEFFRHTSLFQWPLGDNSAYGMALDNSIVYTDSIPLIALILKPFSFIIPDTFQYTGIWIALCFILQGYFSYRLIFKLTGDGHYSLISTFFFICSSAMMVRVLGHYALSAHWLILIGLSLYFETNNRSGAWLALILLSSSIHAYLMAIILTIWMFNIINKLSDKRLELKQAIYQVALTMISLLALMYVLGYFNVRGGTISDGFGYYKLNLNALFNPIFPVFSAAISPLPVGGGDYEGLNYLGLGVIFLAAVLLIKARNAKIIFGEIYERNASLVILCALLTIYALSPNISLGSDTIIHYRTPDFLKGIFSTFRASGRFFWPVFYLIITAILILNHRTFNRKIAIGLVMVACVIQVLDARHSFKEVKRVFSKSAAIEEPKGNIWKVVEEEKRNIIAVPPSDFTPEWMKWGYYASTHNLRMNFGYFARFDKSAWDKQSAEAIEKASTGTIDSSSVYLFKSKAMFEKAESEYKGNYVSGEINGSYVILPLK